jgi:hypothetical protein
MSLSDFSTSYFVLQCCNCSGFVVQQKIKAKKWTCKRCGTQQSFMRKFAEMSTAKQAREALIEISTKFYEIQESKIIAEKETRENAAIYKNAYNAAFSAAAESLGVDTADLLSGRVSERSEKGITGEIGSAWAEFDDDYVPSKYPIQHSTKRIREAETNAEKEKEEEMYVEKTIIEEEETFIEPLQKKIEVQLPSTSIWDEL